MLQPRGRSTTVERLLADGDAVGEALGLAGHDQRRRGIEQRNVAIGARLAVEHAPECDGVAIGCAALKRVAADAPEAGFFRGDLEGADSAVLKCSDEGRTGEGDLV